MNTRTPGLFFSGSGLALALAALPARTAALEFTSPGRGVTARVELSPSGRLQWSLERAGRTVIEWSPLGLNLGEMDLGEGVVMGTPERRRVDETYAWRGIKNRATNQCLAVSLPVRHQASGTDWVLDVRVFEDGMGYRYRVPGPGRRKVRGEASGWTLPAGAAAWYQTDTANYEGEYTRRRPEDIPTTRTDKGVVRPVRLGPPVTVELAQGGFLLLSEAALAHYSGLSLRPTGTRRLEAEFEDDPEGFDLEGPVTTPWRVTVAVPDLNALVNSDLIPNLCDPPDPRLFPRGLETEWIQPGRALITWTVFGNDGAQWHRQKWFVDHCAALGCEYLLLDGGWRTERWGLLSGGGDLWGRLRELVDYGKARGVGIVVWHAFPEGRDDGPGLTRTEDRREFFRRCQEAGVRGVKIDFFDSESRAMIEAEEDLLRLAAEHRLMINFHGSQKPTGEVRTWPHQVTQEGIREQEYLLWGTLSPEHYAALPFTRMAVGHADFLPAYVRKQYLRNTTAVFQMATAILAPSSFLCWPDHPEDYQRSVFLELIRAMPVAWDETRVLEGSEIGRRAVVARRFGRDWWVGGLGGETVDQAWGTRLEFLGDGTYDATIYEDGEPRPEGVVVRRREVRRGDEVNSRLGSGGGVVLRFRPSQAR